MSETTSTRNYGLLAEFDSPGAVMEAAQQVRDAGYKRWDVYTPFPVHGMDQAMGLKNSKVGWFTFIGGSADDYGMALELQFEGVRVFLFNLDSPVENHPNTRK